MDGILITNPTPVEISLSNPNPLSTLLATVVDPVDTVNIVIEVLYVLFGT